MLLSKLEQLAKDEDPYSRWSLTLRLSDMFLEATHEPSAEEKELFGFIIFRLAENLSQTEIATISKMLCSTKRISNSMAFRFAAHDLIEIAQPVLEKSPCLSNEQILDIFTTKSEEHQNAIARRDILDNVVTQNLVQLGSLKTLTLIAGNDGAKFDSVGISTLLERGGQIASIQNQLSRRVKANSYLAELVRSSLTQRLRLKLGEFSDVLESSGLYRLETSRTEKKAQFLRDERAMRLKAKLLRYKLQQDENVLEIELQDLANHGRFRNIIALLASWYSIELTQVQRAFSQTDVAPVMFLLKASDLSSSLFRCIENMRCLHFGHDEIRIEEKVEFYKQLSVSDSKATVELLKDRLITKKQR